MATVEGQALFEHLHTSAVQAGGRRPAAITAIDLPRLASLVGVSEEDLAGKLGDAQALQASGRVAIPQEKVAFEAPLPDAPEAHVRTALLSVASRPSVLDSSHAPKVLMELGGEPVLIHVISQLAAGGIRRIVLVLGARGSLIRSVVEAHALSSRLSIDYVDLGAGYNGGFARSLLEARLHIPQSKPFLICTADHIFDAAIVRQLTADPLAPSLDAVALVERAAAAMVGLPPTVVRVRLEAGGRAGAGIPEEAASDRLSSPGRRRSSGSRSVGSEPPPLISQIGKNVGAATDGIEAGLYLCSAEVFDALHSVSLRRGYFTLAQAMASIAAAGRLGAVFTDGRAWFAIETHDQLELAARQVSSEGGGRFPWQVRLARADSFSFINDPQHAPSDLRLVLAVTAASTAMRALPNLQLPGVAASAADEDAGLECGFSLVPVSTTAPAAAGISDEEPRSPPPPSHRPKAGGVAEPLLPLTIDVPTAFAGVDDAGMASPLASPLTSPPPLASPPAHPVAGSLGALDGDGTGDAALAMSIEVPQGEDASHTAYLINVPEQQSGYILAVPHVPQRREPGWLCGLTPELPSDVTAVRVEIGPSSRLPTPQLSPVREHIPFPSAQPPMQPAVRVTVEKSVPFSGWALLAYAIFATHSAGASINVEITAMPSAEHHVFLRFVWRGMCASLVMGMITLAHHGGRHAVSACGQLTGAQWARVVGAALALFLNKALMAFTSVAHGALYDSTAPMWLVVGQLLRAAVGLRPAVPLANCAGVLLGGVGSAVAMIDDAPTSTSSASHVELFADEVAVFSGLASCLFLLAVEEVRSKIDPTLLYALVLLQFMAYSLIAAFVFDDSSPTVSFDPLRGLFGWAVLSPGRFFAQMWLAVVADYTGTVSFIVVMRYVPALVVAAAMLFSPFFSWAEAMAIGEETVPGQWTMLGGSLVVVGCALIAAQAQHQSMSVEINPQTIGGLESVRLEQTPR